MAPYIWGYDDEISTASCGRPTGGQRFDTGHDGTLHRGRTGRQPQRNPWKLRLSTVVVLSCTAENPPSRVEFPPTPSMLTAWSAPKPPRRWPDQPQACLGPAADVGIGLTGVLGPDEVDGQPPGVVHIALVHPPVSGESVTHVPLRLAASVSGNQKAGLFNCAHRADAVFSASCSCAMVCHERNDEFGPWGPLTVSAFRSSVAETRYDGS